MTVPDLNRFNAGFIPLVDAAPLIVAATQGFAEAEGVGLELTRATSWATIRDRLAVGQLDIAHALAPLPIAANLDLNPLKQSLVVPIAFGFGGNTIVLATRHLADLSAHGDVGSLDPTAALEALAGFSKTRQIAGEPRFRLGIVHPHSAHRYNLEYWLTARGILAGRDVDLVVLPPSLMPDALGAGRIDGFCAGEPWGSVAVALGAGAILTTTTHIWRSGPEKVLAVRSDLMNSRLAQLQGVVRALYQACQWCDQPENREPLAELLAKPEFVGADQEVIAQSLGRRLPNAAGHSVEVPGFLTFFSGAASFPWASQALWFLTQMVRWGEVELTEANIATTRATYRPDIYRDAVASFDVDLPTAHSKVEGTLPSPQPAGSTHGRLTLAPDGFFDGRIFDPDQLESYIAALRAHDRSEGR